MSLTVCGERKATHREPTAAKAGVQGDRIGGATEAEERGRYERYEV